MAAAAKQAKIALRKKIKHRLMTLTEQEKLIQSTIITKKVLASEVYKSCHRISIFLPMKDEVNTLPILKAIFDDGKECFIPHFEGPEMIMVNLNSWAAYENLPTNSWGIKQPNGFDSSQDAIHSGGLDLIFMPGLAFTNQGFRLGRGKGYYDKYLEKCKQTGVVTRTVALLFREQLLENVPVLEYDQHVDTLIYSTLKDIAEAVN